MTGDRADKGQNSLDQDLYNDGGVLVSTIQWLGRYNDYFFHQISPAVLAQEIKNNLFGRFCFILSHPLFEKFDIELQFAVVNSIAGIIRRCDSRVAIQIADLVANMVPRVLAAPDIPLTRKLALYDTLYGLYWCADDMIHGVAPFNPRVVQPFSDYLADRPVVRPNLPPRSRDPAGPRVGFLLNYPNFEPGNAIGPLMMSMLRGYRERAPGHQIFIYHYGAITPSYRAALETFTTVRDSPPISTDDMLAAFRARVMSDQLDYLVTDAASGVATYVFEGRCAPRQVYFMLGFPCWAIRQLDYVFGSLMPCSDWTGLDPRRYMNGRIGLDRKDFSSAPDPALVKTARAQFAARARILAFFGRYIKATATYVRMVQRILHRYSDTVFLATGTGDPTIFTPLISDPALAGRVVLHYGNVDLGIYARVIDVYLDTFPNSAGSVGREVLFAAKPIVGLYDSHIALHSAMSRDPLLIADTIDGYEALVGRLLNDPAFYARCATAASELGQRETDGAANGDLMLKILAAVPMEHAAAETAS